MSGILNLISYAMGLARGGGTRYKIPYGDVPPKWVAKSASLYLNDPLKTQNLVFEWVDFFKILPNLSQKFCKNREIFLKIWPKIGQIGI